jgi:hypothetical protein
MDVPVAGLGGAGGVSGQAAESGLYIEDSEEAIENLDGAIYTRTWERMPPNPSDHPVFRGYLVWPGQEPTLSTGQENPCFWAAN